MPRTLRKRTIILAGLLLAVSVNAQADAYGDARAELIEAYRAQDYAAMRQAADKSLLARPLFPGALFNRALAETLDEDYAAAMATLLQLADMGIHFGVADIEEFAPLKVLPSWTDFERRVAELDKPVGEVTVAGRHSRKDFVPEGIATGKAGEIYLGSIRQGTIVRLDNSAEILSEGVYDDHWSVFGMRRVGNKLWFASSAVPQYAQVDASIAGDAGLFCLNLDTHTISRHAPLPDNGGAQVLGDLVINGNDIYTTDSVSGELYHYSIRDDKFTEIIAAGTFHSPQGLELDESSEHLYVADYNGGLFRISLADGAIRKLTTPEAISDYGIDGLYRHNNELIAIQNGIRPHRVVAMRLSDDGLGVVSSRTLAANLDAFDEPTLGTIDGDDFLFVANSHWNRFDRDNNLPEDMEGPIVLRVSLVN
jgi:sugar lactone lactonase YvrE